MVTPSLFKFVLLYIEIYGDQYYTVPYDVLAGKDDEHVTVDFGTNDVRYDLTIDNAIKEIAKKLNHKKIERLFGFLGIDPAAVGIDSAAVGIDGIGTDDDFDDFIPSDDFIAYKVPDKQPGDMKKICAFQYVWDEIKNSKTGQVQDEMAETSLTLHITQDSAGDANVYDIENEINTFMNASDPGVDNWKTDLRARFTTLTKN